MRVDSKKIGEYITRLRRDRQFTQAELADLLNVSGQAVSKWERGECLPDVGLLPDLADILRVTVDTLLRGGEAAPLYRGRVSVEDVLNGIEQFFNFLRLIGENNTVYQGILEGIEKNESCLVGGYHRYAESRANRDVCRRGAYTGNAVWTLCRFTTGQTLLSD